MSETRFPLGELSNGVGLIDSGQVQNTKRRKLGKPTKTNTMASIIETVTSTSKIQMEDIIKIKQDKQNDLYSLNSEIWKVQTHIPDLELKIEKLATKVSILRSNFQSLENKIKNLEIIKQHKIQNLNDSLNTFKLTCDKDFDKKVAELSQVYDNKVTNIINNKHSKFKNEEKHLIDKLLILKNSLADYSEKILTESKEKIENNSKADIEKLKLKHDEIAKLIQQKTGDLREQIDSENKNITQINLKLETEIEPLLEKLKSKLLDANNNYKSMQIQENNLENQLKKLNNSKEEECNKLLQLKEKCRQYNHEMDQSNKTIKEEEVYRRFLHNKLQEIKGNIRVFCRIKPEREGIFEHKILSMSATDDLKESLIISEPTTKAMSNPKSTVSRSLSPAKKSSKNYTFTFGKIFGEDSSNADIFEEISQLVQSSLDGFNVCIFTYGQTGSGKTFTMSNANDGIIPRSMAQMFEKIDILTTTMDKKYQLYGQFFEIYGDNIRDLIDSEYSYSYGNDENSCIVIENPEISDISVIRLDSMTQIESILSHTSKKRATAFTMANDVSSRSHSIFKVYITSFNLELGKYNIVGTLNLVDLAGSERLAHSQVAGVRLKETLAINKSLSALGDVIASLKSKCSHIPYRNSKLTYALKDSLGGDSKTLMFVNISCLNSHFNESLSSLRFASKVNNTSLK